MRNLAKIILALYLLFAFVPAVSELSASTPDGVPPSEETDCDGQTGAAYGLCNAYCEAMDCDSDDPQASPTACEKVSAKFERITGEIPPCINICPCVGGYPGFSEALNVTPTSCLDQTNPNGNITVFLRNQTNFRPFAVYQPGETTDSFCGNMFGSGNLRIRDQQALVCQDLLRQAADAAGVVCDQ